ncbi:hypothetical protein TYRP_001647 [Tyrophagus putrescentiae]|nr:hypothetical protein TYRP_001647 [Tyrophagus putrescentiae]
MTTAAENYLCVKVVTSHESHPCRQVDGIDLTDGIGRLAHQKGLHSAGIEVLPGKRQHFILLFLFLLIPLIQVITLVLFLLFLFLIVVLQLLIVYLLFDVDSVYRAE